MALNRSYHIQRRLLWGIVIENIIEENGFSAEIKDETAAEEEAENIETVGDAVEQIKAVL